MKNFRVAIVFLCVITLSAFFLAGCQKKEGPVEKAGKKVDETAQSVRKAVKEATQ